MKTLIEISGVISKLDNSEISEEELDRFTDEFIELVEKYEFMFGGGVTLMSEEEYEKLNES